MDKVKGVTIPHHFTKTTIHTSDQLGPPLPNVGEQRHIEKVSSGTSNFPVGNAQNHHVSDLCKSKVNLIKGDRLIDAKRMDEKYGTTSCRLSQKLNKGGRNQSNSNLGNEHRSGFSCH